MRVGKTPPEGNHNLSNKEFRVWRSKRGAAAKWAKYPDRAQQTQAARDAFRAQMTPEERRNFYADLGRLRWKLAR